MTKYILWYNSVKCVLPTASKKELQYPGEIKVSVIHETRMIEYAQ